MSHIHRSIAIAGLAATSLFATGCNSGTSTVVGTVTYRGKPVTSGSVILYCADQQIVRGIIEPDGTYSISNVPCGHATVTVQSHTRAPLGLQTRQLLPRDTVGTPIPPTVDPDQGCLLQLPQRYALQEESGLSISVERGRVTYDINLKP